MLIDKVMPTRHIVLARELTKKYEEYLRGTASEILEYKDEIKGEMVLIISAATKEETNEDINNNAKEEIKKADQPNIVINNTNTNSKNEY